MGARLLFMLALAGVAPNARADGKSEPRPRWQALPLPPAMPIATTKGIVEVDGAKIAYSIFGQGEPVILLHGGMGNSEHFAFQIPALASKFQVIAIDSRGQGRSTSTRAKLSYHLMAGDVIAVMDKLAIASAAMVGWSDGGEIALDLAITYPKRVTKLFVFGANYDSNGSKPRSGAPSATFQAYSARCRADYARLSHNPKSWDMMIDALLPLWRNPSGFTKDQLRAITVPTVVSDGDHDEIIALDQIKEMAELIPNAKLKVFTDTSHFALWQDPASFNQALLEFLGATSTSADPAR